MEGDRARRKQMICCGENIYKKKIKKMFAI